jgi:hypothetical protein
MRVVQTHYSAWAVGIIAGAGCLAALVPGSSTARSTLVGMLLVAANGAAQFLPGILLSFSNRRPSALSIGIGLMVSLLFPLLDRHGEVAADFWHQRRTFSSGA